MGIVVGVGADIEVRKGVGVSDDTLQDKDDSVGMGEDVLERVLDSENDVLKAVLDTLELSLLAVGVDELDEVDEVAQSRNCSCSSGVYISHKGHLLVALPSIPLINAKRFNPRMATLRCSRWRICTFWATRFWVLGIAGARYRRTLRTAFVGLTMITILTLLQEMASVISASP